MLKGGNNVRFNRKITIIVATIALTLPLGFTASHAEASTFTSTEVSEVKRIQNEYAALPKAPYTSANLYATVPHLTDPFSVGKLSDIYINAQLAYINYYRSLFGLRSISTNSTDNQNAQITASVMAAIQADPFTNQHGLPSSTKPAYISDMYWTIAKNVSASANLNFNSGNESPGDVITDLLTDKYNLDGSDTGHRAWLLSTRLSTTGLGAAYGANGYRYSVQQVAYASDIFNSPSQSTVTYPSSGVFPIELLQGGNIAWSVYLSDQMVNSIPTITITDMDTGQKVTATNVQNFSSKGYGNFSTVITYSPGNLNLVSGHQYMVQVGNITSYSFKLFNQVASNQPAISTESSTTVSKQPTSNTDIVSSNTQTAITATTADTEEKDVQIKSALLLKAEKLRDSLKKNRHLNSVLFGRSYQDGSNFFNLGAYQWFRGYYIVDNPTLSAGIIDITDTAVDRNIYSSPYLNLQKPSITSVAQKQSYAYGQTITIGKTRWYYIGPHQWIRQQISKKAVQNY